MLIFLYRKLIKRKLKLKMTNFMELNHLFKWHLLSVKIKIAKYYFQLNQTKLKTHKQYKHIKNTI